MKKVNSAKVQTVALRVEIVIDVDPKGTVWIDIRVWEAEGEVEVYECYFRENAIDQADEGVDDVRGTVYPGLGEVLQAIVREILGEKRCCWHDDGCCFWFWFCGLKKSSDGERSSFGFCY